MIRRSLGVAVLASLVIAACGDDASDDATARVCDAREDVSKEIDTLKGMTPSTFTADAARESIRAIGDDLKTIGEAQKDLNDDRRKEVQAANQQLLAEMQDLAGTVLRSTSAEEAGAQLQAAAQELGDVYSTTLAKVDCT